MIGDDAADIGAAQNAAAVCIGVAWSGHAPKSWRRRWPDVAVARPDRLLDALENPGSWFPCAEVMLGGGKPFWHWGSLLGAAVDLIASVPPKPDQTYDRFAPVRAAIAVATSAVDGGEVLRQRFDDPDYKHQRAEDRPKRAIERFASVALCVASACC